MHRHHKAEENNLSRKEESKTTKSKGVGIQQRIRRFVIENTTFKNYG